MRGDAAASQPPSAGRGLYESDELRELFNAIPIPHITLSVSEEGKPVNTANLEFHSIGNPATVTGIFGGFLNKPILTN